MVEFIVDFMQSTIDGVLKGAVYSVIALAFIVIYRAGRIFNFAQGEIIIFLGFIVWTFSLLVHLPFWLAIGSSLVTALVLGIFIERMIFRPLIGQPLWAIVMVTIGLMSLLQGITLIIWGAAERSFPVIFPASPVKFGPLLFSSSTFWGGIITVFIFFAISWIFERTRWGLKLTAVAEDHQIAQSMGISVKKSIAIAWIISCFLSVFSSIVLFSGQSLNFTSSVIGLHALPIVLLAGLESIWGALLAGIIVGVGEAWAAAYLDPLTDGAMSQAFPFLVMLFILLVRPQGLAGWKIIERV